MRDKHALAHDAIHVEQVLLNEAVGVQDQVSAAYGGFNRVNINPDGTIAVKRIVAAPERIKELEQHLALYFTGFSRTASEVASEQIRMTPQRNRELQLMQEMVDEAEKIITDAKTPIEEFGHMLGETWKIKKTLTQSISNAALDEIYDAGLQAGAVGGKLLGAGGGGFMLFFVSPERRAELRARLQSLLCVPFGFSMSGSQVVVYEPEEPYERSLVHERSIVYSQAGPQTPASSQTSRRAGA